MVLSNVNYSLGNGFLLEYYPTVSYSVLNIIIPGWVDR